VVDPKLFILDPDYIFQSFESLSGSDFQLVTDPVPGTTFKYLLPLCTNDFKGLLMDFRNMLYRYFLEKSILNFSFVKYRYR
jgi:hypothetical protein